MENSSASQISPDWPTRWEPDAFAFWPTLLAALGIVLVVVAAAALIAIVLGIYAAVRHLPPAALQHLPVSAQLDLMGVLDLAAALYLALLLPVVAKAPLRALGFRLPTLRDAGIALLGAIAMLVLVNGLATLIESVLHVKHEQEVVRMFAGIRTPLQRWLVTLFAVVIGPIGGEFVFRIFAFNAARRHWGFWGGAVTSGLLFGLAHADPYAFLPLAIGGMILCGVYYLSRNAWASMLTHALFNSVTVAAIFLAPHLLQK